MKISATSALVLNWTDEALWQSAGALSYTARLDLSEGARLHGRFSEEEKYMHTQAVSGRKYFMKHRALGFLQELANRDKTGQVIVLAAGLAPLSVEIASLFPSCRVFDVDKYLMEDKKKTVNCTPSNIEFIECDITDAEALGEKLNSAGFDRNIPSIAILEGIIYYLPLEGLKNVLRFLRRNNAALACDICLRPEMVNPRTRTCLTEVFRKIREEIRLGFINYYSPEEMSGFLKEAGYGPVSISNMRQIQKARTGDEYPFTQEDSSWVMALYAE